MTTSSKKQVSDAFMPSGGYDSNGNSYHGHLHRNTNTYNLNLGVSLNDNSSSIPSASPLALPPYSSFPPSSLPPQNHLYSTYSTYGPFSPSGKPPPPPTNYNHHHQSYPVPPFNPFSHTKNAPRNSPPTILHNPSVTSAAYLYRSVSADSAATPHSTSNHLVQRLAHQNTLIREAWEAERNYLEANRRRAEEVYQEERAIMEEVREAWENEKDVMLCEIQMLKERVHRLEGENTTLRAVAAQSVQITGVVSPLVSQRGDSVDASAAISTASTHGHPLSQTSSQQSDILPPGLDGASRRPHHAKPGSSKPGSCRTSPTGQPESSPFIPLDPRMQPQVSNPKDFLASPVEERDDPTSIIDVHELDPKLEGISLKAIAVQKHTFGGKESNNASPVTSPPTATTKPKFEKGRPSSIKRGSSVQTLQVLRAEESRRLTMHAGHTPNHSLSLFPTMSVAASSTGAGDESPSAAAASAIRGETRLEVVEEKGKAVESTKYEEDPEEQLEPQDDVRLKGPLMIKNIPAQDEIFWDQVNKKLEQGRDSLPTVMRSLIDEADGGPSGLHRAEVAPVGGDASHDSHAGPEGTEMAVTGQKGVEGEMPLRLKPTTNFGAPFGVA